ncbi:alpha/beta hydrolase [Thalassotalea hakodatensis]|uniref:alpha/beta hydrolase n=1 Tax=Thalassotalea hakodatensis TaxID=3030492 RepID=UPI0025723702|nr:alpha/beta fold hydrolase [Thalassotalea hakodatensis]
MDSLRFQPKVLSLLIILLSAFLPCLATAQATSMNCMSLNEDVAQIRKFADEATFRSVLPVDKEIKFNYQSLPSFGEYLTFARQHIEQLNPKAKIKCSIDTAISELYLKKNLSERTVVDLIQPFEITPPEAETVVLLIHGLTDSPFMFHDLAKQFYQRGIAVRTLLLPGHGTAPSALIDIDEQQWRTAAKYGVQRALKDYNSVYLGGFSTGGALLIDQLLSSQWQPEEVARIKGLLLWSPASKAKSDFAWAARYIDYLPFYDYLSKGADIDIAKYESFAINAGAQVHKLMLRISPNKVSFKQPPDVPVFSVVSDVDTTINTMATLTLLKRWHRGENRQSKTADQLMYFGNEALLQGFPDTFKVSRAHCNNKPFCQHVLNVAHTATTNAPNNVYYGVHGIYRNCQHINENAYFLSCKTDDENYMGETTKTNKQQYPAMQRLTFNPQFDQMIILLDQFINNTSM